MIRAISGPRSGWRNAFAWVALCGCLLLVAAVHPARSDEIAAQGRQVVEKWQDAVITVRLVVKLTMSAAGSQSEEQEEKTDATGTVVDPSGLTVMSLSELDPAEAYKRAMSAMGGRGEGEAAPSFESRVTDVKLRLADGKEVPAKVVLRDADLDLVFLRPVQKLAQPITAVDLTQGASPKLLDQLVTINRLGNTADWVIAPRVDRVQAILAKPRTMYVPQDSDKPGTPSFALDGKIVGITVVRLPLSAQASDMDEYGMAVIMPAADVAEVAKQAAAAE